MKVQKSLIGLIISCIFFTGCSNYKVNNEEISMPDEATKQKTMTKVQNDIDEIKDKDYEYVISNLGEPNVITYGIDKDDIYEIEEVEDVRALGEVSLAYYKNVSEDESTKSALNIYLKNDVVQKAQSVDYISEDLIEDMDKSKIIVSYYKDNDIISMDNLEGKDLHNFEGMKSKELSKIIGDIQYEYNVYLFDEEKKSVKIYELNEDGKLLAVFEEDDVIKTVKTIEENKNVVNIVKDIMLED
ncbi:hypothetical protein [Terrisporobacter sp.]|uniref:hypothetical protein n=1 Tax=Terrisporobacter sp. TaxID=1965305 RepID=UPI002620DCF5|nr:hypothetical protein [Terrisporobacter sp.]